jgi:hypothetical protein
MRDNSRVPGMRPFFENGQYLLLCTVCGVEFTSARPHAKYCSEQHQIDARRVARQGDTRATRLVSLGCEWCGGSFVPTVIWQRFCKMSCRRRAAQDGQHVPFIARRLCRRCGVVFVATHPCVAYCTDSCRSDARRLRRGVAVSRLAHCKNCGDPMPGATVRKVFCTTTCRVASARASRQGTTR